MQWESVIGLEIHVQLLTKSKLFSGAPTAFGAEPNTQACAVDLGLPGVLPVINEAAVDMAIIFGHAIDGKIAGQSVFARKNYFYPDLPKGYQISQYESPIVSRGKLAITLDDGSIKTIGITRAHLEEDAGKSLHEDFHGMTGIDLNRAGTPLLEIVSEPDLRSAAEASAYMRIIHELVVRLNICDGNMQEGSLRCDANVSLRPRGSTTLGTRTEIKNLNSFRFIEQAIEHEIIRQTQILESGAQVIQETRLYDPDLDETRPMRSKEEANDYRYFPDPDLLPVVIDPARSEILRAQLPELREAAHRRLDTECDNLSTQDKERLTANASITLYFDTAQSETGNPRLTAKVTAKLMLGPLAALLNRSGTDYATSPVSPIDLGKVAQHVVDGTISANTAPKIIQAIADGEGDADAVIATRGPQENDTSVITDYVEQVIAANPEQAAQFRAGKDKVLAFLVGQVMKKSQGKANPQQVNEILREKLKQ